MMIRNLRAVASLLLLCATASVLCGSVSAQTTTTSTTPTCILGYTVGFFNGVANTELDGIISLNQTKASVEEVTGKSDDTYNNEDVSYQLFYNHTGSSVGSNWLQDLAETFMQRQQQIDPSGYFSANNLYMMWEEINGGGSTSYLGYTSNSVFPQGWVTTVTSAMVTAMVSQVSGMIFTPPTAQDYATQNAQLDTIAASGRKMLLIAHSQGNLFVDQAYDHIQPVVGSTRVKVVHVAPASPTLRGQWLLSDNDLVINGVRAVGGTSLIATNNIDIAFAAYEPTGHSMGPTYLDTTPGRTNGRTQVEQLELAGLQALTAPPGCAVQVTPATPTLAPGATQTFTAALNPAPDDTVLQTEYFWTVTGNAGGTLPGGVTTLSTETPTVVYTVPAGASSGQSDVVSVKVMASKTAGDQVNAVLLGNGSATTTVSQVQVAISPSTANINTGQTATLNAVVTGAATPPGSYLWSTTGTSGLLDGPGLSGTVTGQKSFCSAGGAVTYATTDPGSRAAGTVTTDTVTVQVFSDANCGAASGSAALASASSAVKVTVVKNVSAWLGVWSTCTNPNNPNASIYLTLYGKPFPKMQNVVDSGFGADLLLLEQNRQNQGVSYNFINVVATDTTLGFDDRFNTYDAAAGEGYSVYSIRGGTLTVTLGGSTYLSCTR